jgi:hypothetical protein
VKSITFSAPEHLIEAARVRAREQHTTLNEDFRRWLEGYTGGEHRVAAAMAAIDVLRRDVRTDGRKFTREEMNERR